MPSAILVLRPVRVESRRKTELDAEFGWGGTSVKP